MFLFLVFLLLLIVLGVGLFVATLFFQSYIYTQPTPGLAWRAPAAAAVLATFYTIWCFGITRSDASVGNIPYDTVLRFSPKVDLFAEPALKIWAVRADGTRTLYKRRKGDDLRFEYVDERNKGYNSGSVVAFEVEDKGTSLRLDRAPADDSGYRTFVSADGWVMQEFESGPTGIPSQSRWGRFLGNLFLNLLHAGLWFVCLWLLLQFRFNDALGFAAVLWLVATVMLVPPLLDQSASIAAERRIQEK